LGERRAEFDKIYVAEQVFDATERLARYKFLPGKPYLNYDVTFVVFRRRDLRPANFPQSLPADQIGQPVRG
jgi:hypothetical protein